MNDTFKLETLTAEANEKYARALGVNGKPAHIVGYVVVSGINAKINSEVREYVNSNFGKEYGFFPVHPHDVLPENLQKKMVRFRGNTTSLYDIIYKNADISQEKS